MRKHYLDNLRSLTIILVMIYHAFYIFNGVGLPTGLNVEVGFLPFDAFCTAVYPWFMVLLFCIAGMTARYSINKRGRKLFIQERFRKLIIPSTLGLLVFQWITGYFNILVGGGLDEMTKFLIYPISALSGIGPLWFGQTVFIFSLLLLMLNRLNNSKKVNDFCEKIPSAIIIALGILVFLGAQVLNVPIISVYRFGIYGVAYFIGYFFFHFDSVMERVEKILPITIPLSLIFCGIYMWLYMGDNYASDAVLKSIITNLYAWFATLAILGAGKRWLNIKNAVFDLFNGMSFGLYVLHYSVLISSAYLLNEYTELSVALKGIILLIIIILITPMLYVLIKNIPFVRYCVLGIKRRKNEIQVNN